VWLSNTWLPKRELRDCEVLVILVYHHCYLCCWWWY
jgi:hypothetical protein